MRLPSWHEDAIAKAHDRASFDCGDNDLNIFLRRYARQSHELGGAKTFLAVDDTDNKTILGFYSIAPGSMDHADTPELARRDLARRELPEGLRMRLWLESREVVRTRPHQRRRTFQDLRAFHRRGRRKVPSGLLERRVDVSGGRNGDIGDVMVQIGIVDSEGPRPEVTAGRPPSGQCCALVHRSRLRRSMPRATGRGPSRRPRSCSSVAARSPSRSVRRRRTWRRPARPRRRGTAGGPRPSRWCRPIPPPARVRCCGCRRTRWRPHPASPTGPPIAPG